MLPFQSFSFLTIALGSYIPDIDLSTTHMGNQHKGTSRIISSIGGGHRGITHTPVVPVLLFLLMRDIANSVPSVAAIPCSIIFGLFLGYAVHLFADLFNRKGIPLFYPFCKKKVHIMSLQSNGLQPFIWLIIYCVVIFVASAMRTL